MYLQTPRNEFSRRHPPVGDRFTTYEIRPQPDGEDEPQPAPASGAVDLPILATANDLREVVKFFKHKPHGVSAVELAAAEPRRVFDARKIAAYEFWGVIRFCKERLFLTALGERLARSTEDECEIHRRILRQIPAYTSAVEHIYGQRLKIATYLDVANFWNRSVEKLHLSPQNEENIEAVIVSFFSLCHAAELGTATVGKRGQPARLTVRLDELKKFLETDPTGAEDESPEPTPIGYRPEPFAGEGVGRVYISAGSRGAEKLVAALELADFAGDACGAENFPHGFLPGRRMAAMRRCQAAIFLLDEDDCAKDGALRCDRVTEISVAQALFGERVIVLWNSAAGVAPPESLRKTNLRFFAAGELNWETNVRLVKCLKNLKQQ